MNKLGKRILSLGLVLSIVCGIGSISVFAASSVSGSINGYTTKGVSSITYSGGSAYTSYGTNGEVTVTSTYHYINYINLNSGSSTKRKGHTNYAQVDFSAPSNCRSNYISSSHKVATSSQTWTGITSKTYSS